MQASGCTARIVLEFARSRGLGAAILRNGMQLEQIPVPCPLVAAVHASHLYFYKGQARKKLLDWTSKPQSSATSPPTHDWQVRNWQLLSGQYYARKGRFGHLRLRFGWSPTPRVALKHATVRMLL